MIPLIYLRQARLGTLKGHAPFRAVAAAIRPQAPRAGAFELSVQFMRRASSASKSTSKPPPKPDPQAPLKPLLSRVIIYHTGMPRVLFLGALKLTTVFVFGFFAVVALPTYVQDAPIWQSAALVVASTIPFLAVWYLTSPMVMWVHLRVPKEVQRSKHRLERYFTNPPAGVSVIITTMGALGKPRVSHVKLADLQRVKQRLGLVNYARDTTLENAQRKWYEFPAVGQFMIEDAPTSGQKAKKPWMWYTLLDGFKNQRLQIARQAKESSKKV